MGCYMDNFGEDSFYKARTLIARHSAIEMSTPKFQNPDSGKVTVCVVNNVMFEAVGVAYSQQEFDAFLFPDGRNKIWLSVDCDTVEKFAVGFRNYVKESKK